MDLLPSSYHYFLNAWPVWAPVIAINIAFGIWLRYVQTLWLQKQGYVLLEIKIPKDQPKSPAAMEFVLQGIWENANISTPADAFLEGKMREWFSLEIVAIGGEVRFFIWAFPRWKKIIESRVYAQYPGAEVVEVKDYALDIHYKPGETFVFGVNTAKTSKNHTVPINTYVEYELHKMKGDEQEEIIDPITPIIEYLGTFGPHEIGCYQILIRAHEKEDYLYGHTSTKKSLKDSGEVKKAVEEVLEKEAYVKPDGDKPVGLINLTDDQKNKIKAIERNAGKLAFDTMVRLFYTAPQDNYEKTRGMGMIGSMRQFGSKNLAGIKPEFFSFTHNWQDFNDIRKIERLESFTDAFRRRAYFGPRHHYLFHKPYVLSTEEVATLYHIPGAVATTPNLKRNPSRRAEAPANLPV